MKMKSKHLETFTMAKYFIFSPFFILKNAILHNQQNEM